MSKVDNPRIPERQRKVTTFNFDQKIQLNVTGNIGTRMKLNVNYNTESQFDFENQMKLQYTGDEDQIVKKIELGTVQMPLSGSLIQGSSSLFGAKIETQWGKLKNTTVLSQQKGERNVLSYLVFGFISVLTGIAIFYLLPLAVLNFDIALILQIFFLILLGMILGLTLISFNLQRLLELAIVNFVLFFERASMKMMIKKNLIAHRESNKLTSIIYSLTLACIIFVVVAANL
jgi:hypothetical protein